MSSDDEPNAIDADKERNSDYAASSRIIDGLKGLVNWDGNVLKQFVQH
jgi:hypothetical protein